MEIAILQWIQHNVVTDWLTPIMKVITTLGDNGAIWILLCFVLLFFKKTRTLGVIAIGALAVDILFCNIILKNLIARPRPFTEAEVDLLIKAPDDWSFPSGHTGASFAVAVIILCYKRLWGACALVLATLIGFSRLYFFVHYPTDVLGGLVVGTLSALIVWYIYCFLERRHFFRGKYLQPLHQPKGRR